MTIEPSTLLLAAAIVCGAYLVLGLTGFGSTVIAMPLLVQFLPLKFAVPLFMLLDLTAFIAFGLRWRHGIRFDEVRRLLPFLLVGMGVGLTLLVGLPERPLLAALGIFVLGYALFGLVRRLRGAGALRRLPDWARVPFGFAGGALSALFGTGGVVFAIYNSARISNPAELRATNASLIALTALLRVILFGSAGLLTQDGLLLTAALLIPALLLGTFIGHRLHTRVPAAAVILAVHAVLIFAGISLLVRAAT